MGELSRRGVKAFAVLSFMAFTSCAIAGAVLFIFFTPPLQNAARTMQPTIRAERSHLSCGTNRTTRTSQRCGPAWTYAACRSRSESNGYRQHCGRVAAQYRLAAPKEESRCLWQWAKRPPESAASVAHTGGERLLCKAKGWGLVAKSMCEVVTSAINSKTREVCTRVSCGLKCYSSRRESRVQKR